MAIMVINWPRGRVIRLRSFFMSWKLLLQKAQCRKKKALRWQRTRLSCVGSLKQVDIEQYWKKQYCEMWLDYLKNAWQG